jgi:phosphoglycolate phosphatase-like HAD superfamily hydrolase
LGLNPVLIWDIDGTILTTGGRGFPSLVRAVQEVTGTSSNSERYSMTHGITDIEVIQLLTRNNSEPITNFDVNTILALYEKYIEEIFTLAPPRILPSIRETLNLINSKSEYKLFIGTGNSFGGAEIKLRTSGAIKFFSESNFFCADVQNSRRINIIQSAKNHLEHNEFGIVIGDTPSDIECAKDSGLHCIAIASGSFDFEELQKCGADKVLSKSWTSEELLIYVKEINREKSM